MENGWDWLRSWTETRNRLFVLYLAFVSMIQYLFTPHLIYAETVLKFAYIHAFVALAADLRVT